MRLVLAGLLLSVATAAQVTEREMERLEAQVLVIIKATTANQEAIMALDKRVSLSDQDQERMGGELESQGDTLAEIRDESIKLKQSLWIVSGIFVLLMKSREILQLLGKGVNVSTEPVGAGKKKP